MTLHEKRNAALVAARATDQFVREDLRRLADRLDASQSFARALILHAIDITPPRRRATVRSLADAIGTNRSTLLSRGFRAGVDLKGLLDRVLLIRIAGILESQTASLSVAAQVVRASSQQHLGRHIRAATGVTACRWRAVNDSAWQLATFEDELRTAKSALASMAHLLRAVRA